MGGLKVLLRTAAVVLLAAVALYKPLPEKLMETPSDRVTMHFLEPLARLFYHYPSRVLCPTAHCTVQWTRVSTDLLNWAFGPRLSDESPLLMETTHWDGVRVRVYHPRDRATAQSDGVVVYMHGGGFGFGSVELFDPLTRTMAEQINTRLFVSIDYRLAPETIFPGAIEDCERVIDYTVANGREMYGADPRKIIVMGDSAGGNLAAVISHRRRDRGAEPKILAQALLYPALQVSNFQTFSYRNIGRELKGLALLDSYTAAFYTLTYAGVDLNAHPEYVKAATRNRHVSQEASRLAEKYIDFTLLPAAFRDVSSINEPVQRPEPIKELAEYMQPFLTNPDFAPLMQPNLSDLPSTLVFTCEFDVLKDDGAIYAERLKQAGVPTQWMHSAHGFHGMLNLLSKLDIARDALVDINNWTKNMLKEAGNM